MFFSTPGLPTGNGFAPGAVLVAGDKAFMAALLAASAAAMGSISELWSSKIKEHNLSRVSFCSLCTEKLR